MSETLLVTGARILDPLGELHRPPVVDVLIRDGTIAALGAAARSAAGATPVLDATGLLVTPGFVNAHCHSHDTLLRGLFEQRPLELWGLSAFPFHWSPRGIDEIAVRTRLHAAECLRAGITTLQDMVTLVGFDIDHAEAVAEAYAQSGVEAVVAPQFSDRSGAAGVPFVDDLFAPETRSRLGADLDPGSVLPQVTALFDRVAAPRFSWAFGPVQPQICSDTLLACVAAASAERGLRCFTHLYETRSEAVLARQTLGRDDGSMVARLARLGLLDASLTIAHGVWITPGEIAVLADHGVGLATNPVTNLKLMNGLAPLKAYRNAGVTVGLGCDNSSASDVQNPFQAMKLFALAFAMQAGAGEPSAATEAFRAATVGGAVLLGQAGAIGRVAVGARANLVFIDLADPSWRPLNSAVRQLVYGETGRGVRHVMVRGQWVVRDGRLVTLDERALCEDAERVRDAMAAELSERLRPDPALVEAYGRMLARVEATPLPIDPKALRGQNPAVGQEPVASAARVIPHRPGSASPRA